jgi:hypothetical protein
MAMKFKPGDALDTAHCAALKHEFLRCEDAFKDFETYGTLMVMKAQAEGEGRTQALPEESRLIAYKTYNAYARFIHHLYEFMLGAVQRDRGSTAELKGEIASRYIQGHAQWVLSGRRQAILNGTAPGWENHISYYPEKAPPEFATKFRQLRNKISAHVTHERASIDLTDFYENYHKYVHMLYWNCLGHWGLRDKEFPDLREITRFSVLIKKRGPS